MSVSSPSEKYSDFRDAIYEHAFKSTANGYKIIGQEKYHDGYMDWIFDFRALLLQPKWIDKYAEIFWEQYATKYPFQVGGMETASIPLIAAIVMKGIQRGTPVNGFYLRKSRKREGLTKIIEGTLTDDPIILVDDIINSGNTFHKQIKILHETKKSVSDIFVIISYRHDDFYKFFSEKNIRLNYLFTLNLFGLSLISETSSAPQRDKFKILWRFDASNPSYHWVIQKSAPVLDEKRLYFGADNGTFYALNQDDGTIIWKFSIGSHPPGKGIFSSPALWKNTIYFGAYDGNVYALDTKTGNKKWVYEEADWIGSSPSIAPDLNLLFIGLEFGLPGRQGGIAAISMDSGKCIWKHYTSHYTHGSPLYISEEKKVVIGSNDGIVYAYDAQTGNPCWRYQTGSDVKSTPSYDLKRRLIVVGSMDTKIYGISIENGTPMFARQTTAGIYSIPFIYNDTAYVGCMDKHVYALDLNTGKDKWRYETAGRIFASPAIYEGSLWVGSNDGKLYELDPESGKVKTWFQFTERIVNRIAYNNESKRFFVPTVANEIYCLERSKS